MKGASKWISSRENAERRTTAGVVAKYFAKMLMAV